MFAILVQRQHEGGLSANRHARELVRINLRRSELFRQWENEYKLGHPAPGTL